MSDPYYETRYTPDPRRDGVWRVLCEHLQRWVPPDAAVLDLAAGYCGFINHIRAREKHAADLSPEFVRHAAPGVRALVAPAQRLEGLADASFDVVFASNLFEHLRRPEGEAALAEVRRVLMPSGRLIVLQPNYRYCVREYFDDYTHVEIYTDRSLADWLEANGFAVRHMIPRWIPFSMKASPVAWPWLVRLYLALPWRPKAAQMLCVAERRTG